MPKLKSEDKIGLLKLMLLSRFGDLREQSLIRQGKGWFHVSGMGHEALAIAGQLLKSGDMFAGYYRDRPIALGRGVNNYDLALAFFAKRSSASGGRQMPGHYSSREKGIFSIASVVGASLVPATGLAWGIALDKKENLVLTTIGDAGTRQGDFYEALAFALEKSLPMVFIVEDNGIGISSVTKNIHPLALGLFNSNRWHSLDGCDVDEVYKVLEPTFKNARSGKGPQFIWARTERISSHSSADDHRKYRSAEELESLGNKDPIHRLKSQLIKEGILSENEITEIEIGLEKQVREDYARASEELEPRAEDLLKHVYGPPQNAPSLKLKLPVKKCRMVDSINATFHAALNSEKDCIFFGQDIEDPKGGVFSLTKGLSTSAPDRVYNSPLAESTIIGVAVGLAAYGKRPVFEIQFADYIWPGFNQLVTHLSTLHWRSNGEWSAPAVIYAPYGAYLPGGALWHSQTNESAIAHFPGIQIAIPSTPEDAAGLFWTAIHDSSPSIILVPKHLMWHPHELKAAPQPIPFGKARRLREGNELTVVCWGNTTEVVAKALATLHDEISVDVIDLRTVSPIDWSMIEDSVRHTGRLLVVQEDAESCSIGQSIVSRIAGNFDLFPHLQAPPSLLSKPDVNIGYNPVLEFAALPDAQTVKKRIENLLSMHTKRSGEFSTTHADSSSHSSLDTMKESFDEPNANDLVKNELLPVPILGEGITSARVISLIAQPGDSIEQDDPLCEVETDKALFPIEAPYAGVLREWLVSEDDEVQVGQAIARIDVARSPSEGFSATGTPDGEPVSGENNFDHEESLSEPKGKLTEGGLNQRIINQLKDVVPAHMTVMAGWEAIRRARKLSKDRNNGKAPSPTAMVAWAITHAILKHPVFSCTLNSHNQLVRNEQFDFGIAVALKNDALETAVIQNVAHLDWPAFLVAYQEAIETVRGGHSRSKAKVPLILTSMGGFHVRDAQPLVVPPAIATLFIGESQWIHDSSQTLIEQVALCLSFDHRWLNGAAGAHFLSDVKAQMESFAEIQ